MPRPSVAPKQHSEVDIAARASVILIESSKYSTMILLGGTMTIAQVPIQKAQVQKGTVATLNELKRKLTATQKRRALKRKLKSS
ncbi:hypothetical protein [Bradyrhizobium sp. LeoA1S1]